MLKYLLFILPILTYAYENNLKEYMYKLKLKEILINKPKSILQPKSEVLKYGQYVKNKECNQNGVFINNQCRCNKYYLGPTCFYYVPRTIKLVPKYNFTLTSFTNGIYYHMRLESNLKNWIGIGFSTVNSPTDGMNNVDMVVIHKKNNNWIIEDMWGVGFTNPKLDIQQNLDYANVWESDNQIIGTWTRKIKSTDILEDLPFSYDMMTNVSYAIGFTNFLHIHEYANTILTDISNIGPVHPNSEIDLGVKTLILIFSILGVMMITCTIIYCFDKRYEKNQSYQIIRN